MTELAVNAGVVLTALAVTLVLVMRSARLDRAQGPCDLAELPGRADCAPRPGR